MVTIVFLPMSFVSSVFGMNVVGIRDTDSGLWVFWAVASATTVVVVGLSLVVAFCGEESLKWGKGKWGSGDVNVRK